MLDSHPRWVQGDESAFGDALRDPARIRVVVREAGHVVLEGVQTGCREDPDLAHRPTGHPAVTHGRGDVLAGPGQHRAAGGAEALGQGDRDEVERRGNLDRAAARGDRGVE